MYRFPRTVFGTSSGRVSLRVRCPGKIVGFNSKLSRARSLDDELLNRFHKNAVHRCIECAAATVNFPANTTLAGGDKEVLITETITKVLINHRTHKKSIQQISRERNLSHNTSHTVLRDKLRVPQKRQI